MTRWRLLETGARRGEWNMACDAALLESMDGRQAPATFRLYGWDPRAVSIGHHQPVPEPEALSRLRERGIDWVRRPTGGRAVYHGPSRDELTYSVVASLADPIFGEGIGGRHRRIHAAIAFALARLGARPGLASRGVKAVRPSSRLACFAVSVPGEIAIDGRKLVGSAQRRTRRSFLQHGSIPLAGGQGVLAEIWPGCIGPDRTTDLSSAVGRSVGFDELAGALRSAFEESLDVELVPGWLTREEEERVEARIARPALA